MASDSPFMQIMSTCKDVVIFQPHTSTVSHSVDLLGVLWFYSKNMVLERHEMKRNIKKQGIDIKHWLKHVFRPSDASISSTLDLNKLQYPVLKSKPEKKNLLKHSRSHNCVHLLHPLTLTCCFWVHANALLGLIFYLKQWAHWKETSKITNWRVDHSPGRDSNGTVMHITFDHGCCCGFYIVRWDI